MATTNARRCELVAAHAGLARRAARRLFGSAGRRRWLDEAESTALRALDRAAKSYDPAAGVPFEAWARRIIAEKLRQRLARLGQRREATPFTDLAPDPDGPGPADVPAREDRTPEPIDAAHLMGLTPLQVRVVTDHYYLGLTFPEIAARLGTTRQSTQQTHRRALAALRRKMAPTTGRDS